jgi:hypothetical protein
LLYKLLFLSALDRIHQVEIEGFDGPRHTGQKSTRPQVTRREWVTTENFDTDFRLTGGPIGNKIQLPKFLAVAIPSKLILPSNITPGRTGAEMLILRGGHFFFWPRSASGMTPSTETDTIS